MEGLEGWPGQASSRRQDAVGNTALLPETADTTGLGVVVQPQFFPGFSASFDYYNIDLTNGISSIGAQVIVDRCYQGITQYCAAITRGSNGLGATVITQIRLQPFNAAQRINRGYDIEASYQLPLEQVSSDLGGTLGLRFLATHYLKNYTNDGINPPYVDQKGSPHINTFLVWVPTIVVPARLARAPIAIASITTAHARAAERTKGLPSFQPARPANAP